MADKNSVSMRVDPKLKEMFTDIKLEKIKNGTAQKMISDARLSKAMANIPNLREVLTKSRFKDEK